MVGDFFAESWTRTVKGSIRSRFGKQSAPKSSRVERGIPAPQGMGSPVLLRPPEKFPHRMVGDFLLLDFYRGLVAECGGNDNQIYQFLLLLLIFNLQTFCLPCSDKIIYHIQY